MGTDADTSSAPTAAKAKAASAAAGAGSAGPRGAPARWLAPIAGVLAALSGAGVLLGWALGLDLLTRPLGPVTVKANAALCFLALGFALWALARPTRHRDLVLAGKGAALGAGVLALLTLSQYLVGYDLGIDQAFFDEPPSSAGASVPGRMAPNTAACVGGMYSVGTTSGFRIRDATEGSATQRDQTYAAREAASNTPELVVTLGP